MNKRQILWIVVIVVMLALAIVSFLHKFGPKTKPKTMAKTVQLSNAEPKAVTNFPKASQPHVVVVEPQNTSIPADINSKYRQGLISKAEAIFEMQKRKYLQQQSFYGKIIDQNGDPVPGVEVAGGNEVFNVTENRLEAQTFVAQSDLNGLFEFTGKTGTPIGVRLKKDGYKWGERGEGYKAPADGTSSLIDRVILTMWKLHGPEKLIGASVDANIPHDGNAVTFDMAKGVKSSNGNLRVTLSQFPLEVKTGRERFDWSVKVEVIDGGLIEENDAYPYWAPANGYQASFEFNISSNAPEWVPNLKRDFYFKEATGQFGRMQFNVYPGRSPTGVEINFTINPSGSQNLEPDFSK